MAVTKEEVDVWVKYGKQIGATHIISACDTFSYDDYPVFVMPNDNLEAIKARYDNKEMQKINEVIMLQDETICADCGVPMEHHKQSCDYYHVCDDYARFKRDAAVQRVLLWIVIVVLFGCIIYLNMTIVALHREMRRPVDTGAGSPAQGIHYRISYNDTVPSLGMAAIDAARTKSLHCTCYRIRRPFFGRLIRPKWNRYKVIRVPYKRLKIIKRYT